MLESATLSTIDRFWSAYYGCPTNALCSDGTLVVPHAVLGERQGLHCLARGPALVVSVPQGLLDAVGRAAERLAAADVVDAEAVCRRLGRDAKHVIGPVWIGYADRASFRPAPAAGVRPVAREDGPAFDRLRGACSDQEWRHAGVQLHDEAVVGLFRAGELVAVSGWERWGEHLAHVGVVTHPDHRARGAARAVVSRLVDEAFARGLIPQYRTLLANGASASVAAALGFEHYATSMVVELAPGGGGLGGPRR